MKIRESGMPEEATWQGFFDPPAVLGKLGLGPQANVVVEFGCGYGTFTLPAARIVRGMVHAMDIDPAMVEHARLEAEAAGLTNIAFHLRDFLEQGTGLADATANYAMLFNILHAEQPEVLLAEAFRVLRPGGRLGIMHWNYDPTTPRGPSLSIRPRPQQCIEWAKQAGFAPLSPGVIALPPYHYGLVLERPAHTP